MKWDVYQCEGGHRLIVENRWDSELVTDTVACPVCENVAVYDGSVEELSRVCVSRELA